MSGWNAPPPPPPPPQGNYTNNLQSGPPLPPRVATRSMGGAVPDSNFSSNGGNVAPPPLPSWTEAQGVEAPQPEYVPNVMPPSPATKNIDRPDMRIRLFHSLLLRNGISMSQCTSQYPVTGTSLSFPSFPSPSFAPCPAPSPHSSLTPHSHPLSVGCELESLKARQAWDEPHGNGDPFPVPGGIPRGGFPPGADAWLHFDWWRPCVFEPDRERACVSRRNPHYAVPIPEN